MELNAIRCNIKKLRKSAGITQREMAAKLFIEERTYSKIERGEQKSMDIRFVASIADILHTKICNLLKDPDPLGPQQVATDPAMVLQENHACGIDGPSRTTDIAGEIRKLKDEIKELILCQKETLKYLKSA
ncbi:helix-turn-helix domain-containing protein [Taibaiella koreensis]|uniref:helix-turn-helix domain-containing protein n=1 Tax=Taibaiella koreensis TaxID=1268548 RepID=UPI000E5A0D74|nr:helix-turn-helix transcriptional regulator [Taibaiella koreensis]